MLTLTGVKIILVNKIIGNASENGQSVTRAKTVGYLNDRYRLGHLWVSEMMLNVQSVLYYHN